MADINLLPHEQMASPETIKLAGKIKGYITTSLVLLIVVTGAGIGSHFVFAKYTKDSKDKVQVLKRQISSLEKSEQKLVLVKDRVDKAQKVLAEDNSTGTSDKFEQLRKIIPEDVVVTNVDLSPGKFDANFNMPNSSSLSNFLQLVTSSNLYSKIEMISLNYRPDIGFSLNLGIYN